MDTGNVHTGTSSAGGTGGTGGTGGPSSGPTGSQSVSYGPQERGKTRA